MILKHLHIEQALKCDCKRLSDKIEELHNCDLKNIVIVRCKTWLMYHNLYNDF